LLALLPGGITGGESGDWQSLPWVNGYAPGQQQARASDRPALLYFQALWCSWCHRYERDILSDPGVQQTIRRQFVPVLVNYDERPELFRRLGGVGLPYTVVVAPQGEVLARLPGILTAGDTQAILEEVAAGRVRITAPSMEPLQVVRGTDAEAYRDFLGAWLDHLESLFDSDTGLLTGHLESGAGIKRPEPRVWLYLAQHDLWPARARRAAVLTRERLFDAVDGGFFYFRDPHRTDEHLETSKLLETNAWLAYWMAFAGTAGNDPQLLATARQTVDFLERALWDRDAGGFYQARLADPAYYRMPPQERARRQAPAVDRVKRADTNAQAAWALAHIGQLLGEARAMELADATVDYLLGVHLRDGRLYHSVHDEGFGAGFNLPDDVFWLLAAAQEVQHQRFDEQRAQRLRPVIRLAADWLDREMRSGDGRTQPVELLGLVAWVTATANEPSLSGEETTRALTGLSLGPQTPPQDPVLGLMAWERLLNPRVFP
jgi:uncharacterized protein YyaL (SSP411 family)